jgi:hypothetical protein
MNRVETPNQRARRQHRGAIEQVAVNGDQEQASKLPPSMSHGYWTPTQHTPHDLHARQGTGNSLVMAMRCGVCLRDASKRSTSVQTYLNVINEHHASACVFQHQGINALAALVELTCRGLSAQTDHDPQVYRARAWRKLSSPTD